MYADVVLDIPTKSLEGAFTYEVPAEGGFEGIDIGCAVSVPFGGRRAMGFVVSLSEECVHTSNTKPLEGLLSFPLFGRDSVRTAEYLSERYVAPLSVCIRLFTPPGGLPTMRRDSDGAWRLENARTRAVDDRWVVAGPDIESFEPRKNAVKQISILDTVRLGDIRYSELSAMFGSISQAVKSLERAGAVSVEQRRRIRGPKAGTPSRDGEAYEVVRLPYDLTHGQRCALDKISVAHESRSGRVVVVDGVTGSGKTEVYLQAISMALKEQRTAIMLVPEISLTPQTVARFHTRFGDQVAVLHSKMSDGERFDQWDMIRSGEARVVVGARSALFAPLDDVGMIIVDEEHETTYKQESAPRYVTRDVAGWMMKERGGTLVLGSATPSIEALYRANKLPGWDLAEMPSRTNGKPMPPVEVIDMTAAARGPKPRTASGSGAIPLPSSEIFSYRLASRVIEELHEGHKVVLLLNQRGFARYMLCDECGFVGRCRSCSTTLTYHRQGNKLVCHHCGYEVKAPSVCPSCKSPYIMKKGVGTERVEAEIRSLLDAEFGTEPDIIPVIRMDADTTSRKGAHRRLLDEFAAHPRAVLLGTQMIAKGLDFDDVTLVGVVDADTQLHLPDFRASERTFDLIEQVAGRAGRGELPGLVMVQTHEPENVAIRAAASYDRAMFLRSELPKRRALGFPPYVRMANMLFWGKKADDVQQQAQAFHMIVAKRIEEEGLEGWDASSAVPCVFERIRNDFRWHFIVKCPTGDDISSVLAEEYLRFKKPLSVSMAIDVDPIDLL